MKIARKVSAFLLSCLLILSCFNIISFAEGQITVKIRIEGINKNLLFKTVTVDEGSSVLDVLNMVDKNSIEIDVTTETFSTGTYIQKINNEEYRHFGGAKGSDGWFYTVNYIDPEPGMTIEKYKVKDGDNIVIYYGDPISTGFYYPEADISNFNSGRVRFISYIKTEDAFGNPTYKVKPLSNALVTWRCGSKTTKFPTDSNGEIFVPQEYRTGSNFFVQIEKTAINGLPLVLRFEPHYMINADGSETDNKMENIFSRIMSIVLSILRTFVSLFEGNIDLGDLIK